MSVTLKTSDTVKPYTQHLAITLEVNTPVLAEHFEILVTTVTFLCMLNEVAVGKLKDE